MIRESDGALLRIFVSDADRHAGQPLGELLVERARAAGLAGATLLHGPLGFGRHARMRSAKLAEAASELPVVVEIVDRPEPIEQFLAAIQPFVGRRLVTREKVRIVTFEAD